MKATFMSRIWRRARSAVANLWHDRSGIAATEFAVIVPVMMVMFFGTVEISTGVAVDRKVTLISRTLSDLVSQTPPDPVQAKMMMFMPIAFSVMFFFFPAGLVLYYVVNNVLSITQQYYITRMMGQRKTKKISAPVVPPKQ